MENIDELAASVENALREFILPDSRFQYDTSCFIPDFAGSAAATGRLVASSFYRDANMLFVTPDNALLALRTQLIRDRKTFLYPSYGLVRGFRIYEPGDHLPPQPQLAATLDGLEHYARPIALAELAGIARCDLVVAGASAVAANGTRFGMGHHYLDCEWPMLSASGFLADATVVATIVHDRQLVDHAIAAPGGHVPVRHAYSPSGVRHLTPEVSGDGPAVPVFPQAIAELPVFAEYQALLRR